MMTLSANRNETSIGTQGLHGSLMFVSLKSYLKLINTQLKSTATLGNNVSFHADFIGIRMGFKK